jgi:hypothetical protein
MKLEDPLAIVQAWEEAANHQNIDRLIELSAPDIEIIGPRGAAQGHQVLRDWLGRAGLTLKTFRSFGRNKTIVLAQHGSWRSVETGEVMGEQNLATCFHVNDRQVIQVARYDSLDLALAEAGLDGSDEIRQT